MAQPQQAAVPVGQPMQQFTVVQAAPRPNNFLALSIMTCICCNPIFGLVAIIMSSQSSSHADAGNMDDARKKGKVALGLSIAGIVITIVSVAAIVLATFVFIKGHTDAWEDAVENAWDQAAAAMDNLGN